MKSKAMLPRKRMILDFLKRGKATQSKIVKELDILLKMTHVSSYVGELLKELEEDKFIKKTGYNYEIIY